MPRVRIWAFYGLWGPCVLSAGRQAQEFGFDASFDPSIFDDPSLFEGTRSSGPFTLKLSQQTFAHVNRHGGTAIDGSPSITSRGTEINRSSLLLKYQNAFAPGWLLQGSAQAKAYWSGDYEYDANDGHIDTDLRVNELFVQRSTALQSVSFGRQTVVWGETEGNSVLDVINTSEFRDLTIIDIEDARRNQWFVLWDYFGAAANDGSGNSGSWSSFLNLYPEFNPAPVRGSPFFFEPPFNLTDYRRGSALSEFGTRWSRSFSRSDIAVMGARLYENQLRYGPPPAPGGDAVAEANSYWLLGFSANRATGRLLLKFDLAFSGDVIADTVLRGVPSFAQRKDKLGTSFGFEYALSNEQQLSVGILAERFLDQSGGLAPDEVLMARGTTGNVLLRYSNALRNNDLMLNLTAQRSLSGDSTLLSFAAAYTLTDNWNITGQIIATRADRSSPLHFLDQDVRLGATVSWSF
jgi:hypothetical protein